MRSPALRETDSTARQKLKIILTANGCTATTQPRFPRHAGEVPQAAVRYVASQVKVDPALFRQYTWTGSTIEYHRAQIRAALGFREPTRADEERLTEWLATEIWRGPKTVTDALDQLLTYLVWRGTKAALLIFVMGYHRHR